MTQQMKLTDMTIGNVGNVVSCGMKAAARRVMMLLMLMAAGVEEVWGQISV